MSAVLDQLRSLLILVIGVTMAIVGSKMHDELIRGIGLTIIGTALGITFPGIPGRDPATRTRITDETPPERQQSGR